MVCRGCGKDSPGGFSFCPHCGMALVAEPPATQSTSSAMNLGPVVKAATEEGVPSHGIASDGSPDIGTWVFGAFSVISLLVSMVKGIVPIYLVESAIWGGAAWYWHGKKPHSELGKTMVIVFALLVAVGELIHITSQSDVRSQNVTPAIPSYLPTPPTSQYPTVASSGGSPENAPSGPSSSSGLGFNWTEQSQLKSESNLGKGNPTGIQATISCDVIAYDRDKYGDGDPKAITSLHEGETVPYVGHVTIGDEDIIRVHGRKGFVSGCVDVKLGQETASSNLTSTPKWKKETHGGLQATITCDEIVWDRDKYGDGDPIAIASVHQGDTFPYVGHVTIGDEEIIRVHGRRGYVSGCVDVKQ